MYYKFERSIFMATFNELYRKYVGPLPDDGDEGIEEALCLEGKKAELEEEAGIGIEI